MSIWPPMLLKDLDEINLGTFVFGILWGGGFGGAAVLGKTFVTLQEGSEARS